MWLYLHFMSLFHVYQGLKLTLFYLKILHGSLLLTSLGGAALHSSVLLPGLPKDYFS